MRLTRSLLLACGLLALFAPFQALAQGPAPFDVLRTDKVESFSLPYSVANLDRDNPSVFTYDGSKGQNWIFTVDDKLTYLARNDSKIVITIREQAPSEKFVQLWMYGGEAHKFAVTSNTPDVGYRVEYQNDVFGWSTDDLVSVTHAGNHGLTVTDGKRIVIDGLDLNGFDPASVEVYGKDEQSDLANAAAGTLGIAILFGNPADSPLYLVPAGVMIGVGALVGALLYSKKRKK